MAGISYDPPAGSGSGAVTSVATRTGDVVLTAADVGAGTFPGNVSFGGTVTLPSGIVIPSSADISGVLGTSGSKAAAGNDSRLSDARTPTAHATSHRSGGSDAITIDQFAAAAADVSFGSHKATNVLDPTAAQDGATKNYVDGKVQGRGVTINGYLAQSLDLDASGNTTILVAGTKYVLRIPLLEPITFTTVDLAVTTAGNTLTASQSLIAAYDKNGTKVGSTSADQSTAWTSSGIKSATVGTPGQLDTNIFIELVCGGGTTMPTFARGPANFVFNANVTGATLRASTNGTGATTVDASITPASLSAASAPIAIWVGLR